ncbi:hypothetical protein WJX73_008899 [Symbiochloris irregularis]|uniref:F-box domain-containing protein n=1 Tax=Symbiochloris irregularis TaxID=706552 RepID=A0AAW1NR80_9CHLO
MALSLPTEIINKILKLLAFEDKVNLHLVCKTWNALLRHPSDSVWGSVRVDDRRLRQVYKAPSTHSFKECVQKFEPISRWLQIRSSGITAVQVFRFDCAKPDETQGRNRQLTALLACMSSVPVDMSLKVFSKGDRHLFLENFSGGPLNHLQNIAP